LLLKIRRSSSMSLKPAGGALRFETWRMAGILGFLSSELGFERGSIGT
jgi:hypothetical protein